MNTEYWGTIWSPEADVYLHQHAEIFGGVLASEHIMENYAKIHYDEALAEGQWIPVIKAFKIFGKRRVL